MSSRVGIAFDDTPLEPSPTWTWIDAGGDFPQNFVSGYDIKSGRQTLIAQTDTGTGTVYVNDFKYGLFDPRNSGSPYYGKLDGKQILLQLYDPVREVWEEQFRGHIEGVSYDIDANTTADGIPVNASIQIDCVDLFDYLAGFGLTPGYAGVAPAHMPSGTTDGVWYAETSGTVDGRIIEILTDCGLGIDFYTVFTGNVAVQAVKYDPDQAALTALRDACDAEIPFIANMYCDRHGVFCFHGRYSRFDPDFVAEHATPGVWNFTRWKVGDGAHIVTDPTRAQMRVLSFNRPRSDIINVAVSYPANIKPVDMPNQVYADPTSITDYGEHSAQPMSDLIVARGIVFGHDPVDRNTECFKYAELLVRNKKDPREAITALQVKSLAPVDARAARTWALITQADISDIVNVAAGYPGGVGFTGSSPDDDYYIEGRQMRVRPLQPGYDYVELDLEVSPAVWSMDTHGVFPGPPAGGTAPPDSGGSTPPTVPSLTVVGGNTVGDTLVAAPVDYTPTTYQWGNENPDGTGYAALVGFVSNTYVVQAGDTGKVLVVDANDGVTFLRSTPSDVIGVTGASGVPAPTGDISGWRLIFVDDFSNDVPDGSGAASSGAAAYFPQAVSSRWSAYPYPWAGTPTWATYFPERVLSQHDSMLDFYIHDELIGGVRKYLIGAITPKVNGPGNPSYLPAGRFEIRWKSDTFAQYHASPLLWPQAADTGSNPWPASGEIDWPEADTNSSSMSGFMHEQGGTSGADQQSVNSATAWGGDVWHTSVIEWVSGTSCKFFLDGVQIGSTFTSRVPTSPMRWVLQLGGSFGVTSPTPGVSGHWLIDWVAVYVPSP